MSTERKQIVAFLRHRLGEALAAVEAGEHWSTWQIPAEVLRTLRQGESGIQRLRESADSAMGVKDALLADPQLMPEQPPGPRETEFRERIERRYRLNPREAYTHVEITHVKNKLKECRAQDLAELMGCVMSPDDAKGDWNR